MPFLTLLLLTSCGETAKEEKETEAETASEVENNAEDSIDAGTILFFGDSLTAAMGLDPAEGIPPKFRR